VTIKQQLTARFRSLTIAQIFLTTMWRGSYKTHFSMQCTLFCSEC